MSVDLGCNVSFLSQYYRGSAGIDESIGLLCAHGAAWRSHHRERRLQVKLIVCGIDIT